MDTTKLDSLINPQVMADMIRAELEKKLRATQFFKINRTLTGGPVILSQSPLGNISALLIPYRKVNPQESQRWKQKTFLTR